MYEKISAKDFALHLKHGTVLRKTFSTFYFKGFEVRFLRERCGKVSYWLKYKPPESAGAILPQSVGAESGPSFHPADEGGL